MIEVMD